MAGLHEGGNEPPGSLKATIVVPDPLSEIPTGPSITCTLAPPGTRSRAWGLGCHSSQCRHLHRTITQGPPHCARKSSLLNLLMWVMRPAATGLRTAVTQVSRQTRTERQQVRCRDHLAVFKLIASF
ncbi:hypothetical protein ANN_18562 [Periplaneta americana]|uniref:Uncharacterized protein n=1 Tax=Periplaneta americana TaxID=6978 RepID=A0ABQ8SP42_PERAM|nr:hypothetical protein ANN_18562 [Periplaneta americana]